MRSVLWILLCVLLAVGCSQGNLTELTDEGVMARTATSQVASIDPDGTLRAAYNGIGPTQLVQDSEGNWVNMPGPVGIASMPFGTDKAFIIAPGDIEAKTVTITPVPVDGQPLIKITGLKINATAPMEQQVAALQIALPILSEMTKTEAEATIEKWRVAGEIAPSVLDLLAQFVALM